MSRAGGVNALTINGNGILISGNDQHRIFFIDAPGKAIQLNNMVLLNGHAKVGNGNWGGGGGMGAGGAVFLEGGDLTLANVGLTTNAASGGTGSHFFSSVVGGGGGGLGGMGGDADASGGGGYLGTGGLTGFPFEGSGGGGGGGLYGVGGVGKVHGGGGAGFANGAHATVAAPGFGGVGGGGAGAAGTSMVGGGGGGGGSPSSIGGDALATRGGHGGKYGGGGGHLDNGGNGGDYGGGGGGRNGGAGGLGGGGGGGTIAGGNGGFGGGGGSGQNGGTFGAGGAFAGNGALGGVFGGGYGGGGAALGAHVFARPGTTVTFVDTSADAGSLAAGLGSGSAGAGQTRGSSFFLGGNATFNVTAGQTRAVTGSIADVDDQLSHPTATEFAHAGITKTGAGTLILAGVNRYNGATVISQGTLQIDPSGAQQQSDSSFVLNDAGTGAADTALLIGPASVTRTITVANAGAGTTTIGSTAASVNDANFNGSIALGINVTLLGQNTAALPDSHNGGQTRFNSTMSGVGGVVIAGGNMVQYRDGSKRYTGVTRITGNSTLSLFDNASTPANSTVHIDTDSALVLEGLSDGVIGALSGSGNLSNNEFYAGSKLTVGGNGADTSFTGRIDGNVELIQSGVGTLELGARNNSRLRLGVEAGRIRLAGDHVIGGLTLSTASKGAQTLDLAGYAMRLRPGGSADLSIVEHELNAILGTSSDGAYDSIAKPNMAVGIAWKAPSSAVLMKLTLLGDTDVDGQVGFGDLLTVAANFGKSGQTWDEGDFNRDGMVGFVDLLSVSANFGLVMPEALPAAQAPEPAAAMLLAALLFVLTPRRRFRS